MGFWSDQQTWLLEDSDRGDWNKVDRVIPAGNVITVIWFTVRLSGWLSHLLSASPPLPTRRILLLRHSGQLHRRRGRPHGAHQDLGKGSTVVQRGFRQEARQAGAEVHRAEKALCGGVRREGHRRRPRRRRWPRPLRPSSGFHSGGGAGKKLTFRLSVEILRTFRCPIADLQLELKSSR